METVKTKHGLKAIDFFCSGGGMSFGLQESGIQVLAGIDFDEKCKSTYKANIHGAEFIHANISDLKEVSLQEQLSLSLNDDDLILIGCSPCQFWSLICTDKTKSNESKNLLIEFKRFVKYFNPGYVVVENVPGVLKRKEESGLGEFIKWLIENKYKVHFDVHEVSDYEVPQNRKRFTLIANRVTSNELAPIISQGKKLHVRDVIGEHNGFPKVNHGHKDPSSFLHTVAGLKKINIDRLLVTPKDGGGRMAYVNDEMLAPKCHKGKTDGFGDVYGRMWWDRPSPTITTRFNSLSNGRFGHPEEDRAISLREGAVLQSFPKTYVFIASSIDGIAKMIGNAVPPKYAAAIGMAIVQNHENAV